MGVGWASCLNCLTEYACVQQCIRWAAVTRGNAGYENAAEQVQQVLRRESSNVEFNIIDHHVWQISMGYFSCDCITKYKQHRSSFFARYLTMDVNFRIVWHNQETSLPLWPNSWKKSGEHKLRSTLTVIPHKRFFSPQEIWVYIWILYIRTKKESFFIEMINQERS